MVTGSALRATSSSSQANHLARGVEHPRGGLFQIGSQVIGPAQVATTTTSRRGQTAEGAGGKQAAPSPAAPSPVAPSSAGVKPGDWACPSCNHHNFASRTNCRGCGAGKQAAPSPAAPSSAAMKSGDWACPSCNHHNFASRTSCRNCNSTKIVASSVGGQCPLKQGDWTCRTCTHLNFGSRAVCRQCGEQKEGLPAGWDPMPAGANLTVVEVGDGAEKDAVVRQFMSTVMGQTVVKVERVQNRLLWKRYDCERGLMKNPKSLDLFHGTRNTAPQLIYDGQDGFDMRFCHQGLWGIASYFSTTAHYSHSYSYKTPSGTRQMFLASVLVGNICNMGSSTEASLRLPPEMPQPPGTAQAGGVVRYDSVSGVTANTTVHMIYSNARAYPRYLITYEECR